MKLKNDQTPIRILVVDDYEPFQRFVASSLAQKPELQIVGQISDGLEAVQKAGELLADLILLDIGLPGLNGVEAAHRIRELSPKSKILFFSENRSQEIVEEAFRTGAAGYLVKSDAGRQLLTAVDTVLQGAQFVSSSLPGYVLNGNGDEHTGYPAFGKKAVPVMPHKGGIVGHHEVVFYSDDRQLLDRLSQFIGAALSSGNAAILVATGAHQESLMQGLRAYGVDMAAAVEQGRYIALDAADTLSSCMVNGMLDSVLFLQSLDNLILKAATAAQAEHPRVAFFGECVDLLLKQGNAEAAIQIEKLGAQLSRRYDVDILCGYSLEGRGVMEEEVLQRICAEHSAVYSG